MLAVACSPRRFWRRGALYPEAKKLGQQLKYADRRGFRVAIIMGENELAENACQVKLLSTGGTTTASLADSAKALVAELRRLLARLPG